MSRFDYRKLPDSTRQTILRELAQSIAKLKKADDIQRLLEQLLTPSEVTMLGRRWQIAKLLLQNKSYLDIRYKLGVGFTTIEAVDKWLRKTVDDHTALIDTLFEKPHTKKRSFRIEHRDLFGTFGDLRHRYPLHFLLVNLILDARPKPAEGEQKEKPKEGREGRGRKYYDIT